MDDSDDDFMDQPVQPRKRMDRAASARKHYGLDESTDDLDQLDVEPIEMIEKPTTAVQDDDNMSEDEDPFIKEYYEKTANYVSYDEFQEMANSCAMDSIAEPTQIDQESISDDEFTKQLEKSKKSINRASFLDSDDEDTEPSSEDQQSISGAQTHPIQVTDNPDDLSPIELVRLQNMEELKQKLNDANLKILKQT